MYFFISDKRFADGTILYPRVPINRLTENGTEDNQTKRVCICKSIIGALTSTELYTNHKIIYVYTCNPTNVVSPTCEQVDDNIYTGEEWSLDPISITMFTILHVTKTIVSKSISQWHFADKDSAGFYRFNIYGIDYARINNT